MTSAFEGELGHPHTQDSWMVLLKSAGYEPPVMCIDTIRINVSFLPHPALKTKEALLP